VEAVNEYLVDTVAFVRYLEDRLTPKSERVFDEAEAGKTHLLPPQIALAEFMYIALRGRLKGTRRELQVRDVLHNLTASEAFTISSMPTSAWDVFTELSIPALHDRMIAAEAIAREIPLVSNDPAFREIEGLTALW
jgi:predicted nucleic acid-binding protein